MVSNEASTSGTLQHSTTAHDVVEQANLANQKVMEKLLGVGYPEPQRPIFKVHDILRNVNRKAYEPEIVSIGPYHQGTESLCMMEEHKWRYLKHLFEAKEKESRKSIEAEVKSAVSEKVVEIDERDEFMASCRAIYDELKPSLKDSLTSFKEGLRETAEEARKKYDVRSFPDLKEVDEFLHMLILDGCFIIELLRKNSHEDLRAEHDPIFNVDWMRTSLQRDLLLLENQLPFNVLCKLFDLIDGSGRHGRLAYYACCFFGDAFYGLKIPDEESFQTNNVEHLLDLIHSRWNPNLSAIIVPDNQARDEGRGTQLGTKNDDQARDEGRGTQLGTKNDDQARDEARGTQLGAKNDDQVRDEGRGTQLGMKNDDQARDEGRGTQLGTKNDDQARDEGRGTQLGTKNDDQARDEARRRRQLGDESRLNRSFFSAKRIIENGVVFKKSKNKAGSLFAIEFREKKVRFHQLRFQQLMIEGRTETFFRNFIAYEQYFKDSKGNFVTDYVNFLGNLIDSAEDVELLCHHRLLDNKLGDSKSVVDLFTKINECVTIHNPDNSSPYAKVYRQLNVVCNKRRNYWKAYLWGKYCNPWGIPSIILALLGLTLTVVMLVFAVRNYNHNKKH